LRGLTVLAKQERDPLLRRVIVSLAEGVQGGGTFSESLAGHPRIFNKLYVNMVKAGELGGVLELVLLRLAEFQEKAQKIKNKVVSAMFYPIIVLLIAILILGFLLVFIVPKFQAILRTAVATVAPLTLFVIGASSAVKSNIFLIIGAVVGIGFLLRLVAKTAKGALVFDTLKLKAPLFGDLTRKSAISRFSRTLGTLVTSGVPILQALTITGKRPETPWVPVEGS
jgi:type IV pilus assembly protein PilC